MAQTHALAALARIGKSLGEAELRTLLELSSRSDSAHKCQMSSRQLAEATGLSRPNVQAALRSLCERQIITSDGGSATQAATFTLGFLAVVPMVRGSFTEPPQEKICGKEPLQVALFQSHPGSAAEPPLASQQSHPGFATEPPLKESSRAPAHTFVSSDFDIATDRSIVQRLELLLKATPAKYDPSKLAKARDWMHGYMAKFGRLPDPHPPDEQICAQLLAIAEWPRLEGMFYDLMGERKQPGHAYAWFVTVAVQRLWGVAPSTLKNVREKLKLVKGDSSNEKATKRETPAENKLQTPAMDAKATKEFAGRIRAAAAAKAMR